MRSRLFWPRGKTFDYQFLHDRIQQAAYALIPHDQNKPPIGESVSYCCKGYLRRNAVTRSLSWLTT
ncbi:MAG: hypothetical protein HC922_10715 [Leptolyngbyaceae cyanobacterium SM2_3_12]|nr:hypothetical protein [Leptolyngbyaceae cyanobacterium SM2_3_12]